MCCDALVTEGPEGSTGQGKYQLVQTTAGEKKLGAKSSNVFAASQGPPKTLKLPARPPPPPSLPPPLPAAAPGPQRHRAPPGGDRRLCGRRLSVSFFPLLRLPLLPSGVLLLRVPLRQCPCCLCQCPAASGVLLLRVPLRQFPCCICQCPAASASVPAVPLPLPVSRCLLCRCPAASAGVPLPLSVPWCPAHWFATRPVRSCLPSAAGWPAAWEGQKAVLMEKAAVEAAAKKEKAEKEVRTCWVTCLYTAFCADGEAGGGGGRQERKGGERGEHVCW